MITIQKYVRAQTLEEAWQLNQSKANRIMGGMMWLRLGSGHVNTAVDLCDLGLDTIEETADSFVIGAMTSLRSLEMHEGLNAYCHNAVANAVKDIVGVQFRNMATIGGSVWGRYGFSDVLTVLLAMDCHVELYKGGMISLSDFVQMKPDNDLLVHIIIRKQPMQMVYTSMRNQRTDFPVIACATACVNGEYRLSVGARPNRAMLVRDENGLLKDGITLDSAKAFAAFAADSAPTGSNVRASAEYRTHLIRVLVERSLLQMGGN